MLACEGVVCGGRLHIDGDMNTRRILVMLVRVCTITCPYVGGVHTLLLDKDFLCGA